MLKLRKRSCGGRHANHITNAQNPLKPASLKGFFADVDRTRQNKQNYKQREDKAKSGASSKFTPYRNKSKLK